MVMPDPGCPLCGGTGLVSPDGGESTKWSKWSMTNVPCPECSVQIADWDSLGLMVATLGRLVQSQGGLDAITRIVELYLNTEEEKLRVIEAFRILLGTRSIGDVEKIAKTKG